MRRYSGILSRHPAVAKSGCVEKFDTYPRQRYARTLTGLGTPSIRFKAL